MVYYIGYSIGWEKIWTIIKNIKPWQLGVILILPLSWNMLHALGWFFLVGEKKQFRFYHFLEAQISSTAVAEVVPLGQAGGEPYRAYYVKNRYSSNTSPNIVASVILYNTVHTLVTGCLMVAGFLVLLSVINVSVTKRWIFSIGLLLGFFAVLIFIQKQKTGFMEKIFSFLGKFKIFHKIVQKKQHKAVLVDERLKVFYQKNKKSFYGSLLIILVAKFLGAIEFYLILNFIDANISFSIAFLVFAANAFVQLFLFFFPAQIGASEGSIYYLFKILGKDPLFGISLALFRRIRALLWTLIGLVLGYLRGPGKKMEQKDL